MNSQQEQFWKILSTNLKAYQFKYSLPTVELARLLRISPTTLRRAQNGESLAQITLSRIGGSLSPENPVAALEQLASMERKAFLSVAPPPEKMRERLQKGIKKPGLWRRIVSFFSA